MARNVPERFVRPLSLLAHMPEESYRKAIANLSGDAFLAEPKAFMTVLNKAHPELTQGDARELALYLQTMAGIAISPNHREIGEVLAEMVQGDNLELNDVEREGARKRALGLVGTEAVRTLAFIMTSYWQHERPVTEISMAVDIRPAFDSNNQLLAMTPWQTLLVTYGEDSHPQSVEFSLDRDDLESLKTQVERTLTQLAAVEAKLEAAGIRIWSLKSEAEESED